MNGERKEGIRKESVFPPFAVFMYYHSICTAVQRFFHHRHMFVHIMMKKDEINVPMALSVFRDGYVMINPFYSLYNVGLHQFFHLWLYLCMYSLRVLPIHFDPFFIALIWPSRLTGCYKTIIMTFAVDWVLQNNYLSIYLFLHTLWVIAYYTD